MACVNMQVNNETQGGFIGPRISFSNDFGDTQQSPNMNHHQTTYREAPVSSDFEFPVPSFSSNSADQVFFKRKVLPLKEKVVTLRDELLAGGNDDDDDIFLPRLTPSKNHSGWWRERFGRGRNAKKGDGDHKNLGGLETIDEAKINPTFVNQLYNANFTGTHQHKGRV